MNKHDRDNLEFLLNATPEVLEDWYNQMDDDDIEYAVELIEAAQVELDQKVLALQYPDRNLVLIPTDRTLH